MAHQVTFNFQPGDKVFIMDENIVKEGTVKSIQCDQDSDGVRIFYNICTGYPAARERIQDLVFGTKEDLLASL